MSQDDNRSMRDVLRGHREEMPTPEATAGTAPNLLFDDLGFVRIAQIVETLRSELVHSDQVGNQFKYVNAVDGLVFFNKNRPKPYRCVKVYFADFAAGSQKTPVWFGNSDRLHQPGLEQMFSSWRDLTKYFKNGEFPDPIIVRIKYDDIPELVRAMIGYLA